MLQYVLPPHFFKILLVSTAYLMIGAIKEGRLVAKMDSDDSNGDPDNDKYHVDRATNKIRAFAVLERWNKMRQCLNKVLHQKNKSPSPVMHVVPLS